MFGTDFTGGLAGNGGMINKFNKYINNNYINHHPIPPFPTKHQ